MRFPSLVFWDTVFTRFSGPTDSLTHGQTRIQSASGAEGFRWRRHKKCVLSGFLLKTTGLAAARLYGGSEFHASGPAHEKERSPNLLVMNPALGSNYLSSRRASPAFGQHLIILRRDKDTCVRVNNLVILVIYTKLKWLGVKQATSRSSTMHRPIYTTTATSR